MKYQNSLLNEREKTHGDFNDVSECSQVIKGRLMEQIKKHANDFNYAQIEALDMICVKLARIVCGDPNFLDTWRDISNYAELITEQLKDEDGATDIIQKKITRKKGVWLDVSD